MDDIERIMTEIADLRQNWQDMEPSPASRALAIVAALHEQYQPDDLLNMLRDAMADIHHAYDLLGFGQEAHRGDARAAAMHYSAEVRDMGSAAGILKTLEVDQ